MPQFHQERFLTVAGITHKSVLIAWGSFFFRIRDNDNGYKLVDDEDLKIVNPARSDSIGEIENDRLKEIRRLDIHTNPVDEPIALQLA